MNGYVYVIGSRDHDCVKIGITRRGHDGVYARLEELQCASPFPLEVVAKFAVVDPKKLEAQLHARFGADRLQGEWFLRSPAIEAWLQEDDLAKIASDKEPDTEKTYKRPRRPPIFDLTPHPTPAQLWIEALANVG